MLLFHIHPAAAGLCIMADTVLRLGCLDVSSGRQFSGDIW